jgi:hypothetical protein
MRGASSGVNTILVTSLTTWNQLTNMHFPPAGPFYVSADEGGGTLPEAPYTWEAVRLDCATTFEGGCGGTDMPAGLYGLKFDGKVLVTMGQSARIPYANGGLIFRNLRSFVTGYCDDYWNFAHWAIPQQLGD